MIAVVILCALFGVACIFLAYLTALDVHRWNQIFGKTQWDQTLCGYFLTVFCGGVGLVLICGAVVMAYQLGHHA